MCVDCADRHKQSDLRPDDFVEESGGYWICEESWGYGERHRTIEYYVFDPFSKQVIERFRSLDDARYHLRHMLEDANDM